MSEDDMPKGAIATVRDLDLCVELDEPTLLVERVLKTAEAMQFLRAPTNGGSSPTTPSWRRMS